MSNLKISYFNLDRNNHSQKRNLGIKKAKSKINKINYVSKRSNTKTALIFTGPLSEVVDDANRRLLKKNIKVDIINLHQIKPLTKIMLKELSKYKKIMSKLHPDKNDTDTTKLAQMVSEAKETILKNDFS